MSKLEPRNLDHAVLPVTSLKIARARMAALGFVVAPDARHNFGSENALVCFANGTFIESLAIGHRETVEANEAKGNTFLRRDAGYRFRHGDTGFSMVAFIGKDAVEDRRSFKKAGYETGKIIQLKRPGLRLRLVFARDERAPDFTLFLCERPDGPPGYNTKLTTHANGAKRLSRITLYEPVPSDFQYYLQTVSGQRDVRSHSFGMDQVLPNGVLTTLTAAGLAAHYGIDEVPQGRGLRAMAVDVTVKDLAATKKLLKANAIACKQIGARLVVPPAPGQGAALAFVEG